MRLSLPASLSLLLFAWQAACAQSADDFFNSGAQFYISNNIAQARESAANGLKLYPGDTKLKKLDELLKQQSQQSQQQKANGQQGQPQQNQQPSQPNSPEQQKPDEQNQSGQKQGEQQKQQQQKTSAEKQNGQENQNEPGQPVAAGQMTPKEAKQLLDAQKGNEQVLQLKPPGKAKDQNQPIKDW